VVQISASATKLAYGYGKKTWNHRRRLSQGNQTRNFSPLLTSTFQGPIVIFEVEVQ